MAKRTMELDQRTYERFGSPKTTIILDQQTVGRLRGVHIGGKTEDDSGNLWDLVNGNPTVSNIGNRFYSELCRGLTREELSDMLDAMRAFVNKRRKIEGERPQEFSREETDIIGRNADQLVKFVREASKGVDDKKQVMWLAGMEFVSSFPAPGGSVVIDQIVAGMEEEEQRSLKRDER